MTEAYQLNNAVSGVLTCLQQYQSEVVYVWNLLSPEDRDAVVKRLEALAISMHDNAKQMALLVREIRWRNIEKQQRQEYVQLPAELLTMPVGN